MLDMYVPRELKPEELYSVYSLMEAVRLKVVNNDDIILGPARPMIIMDVGLRDVPTRRADILHKCLNGMSHATAASLPPEVAGLILENALKVEDTTTQDIYSALTPEDVVRYLGAKLVWDLLHVKKRWPKTVTVPHQDQELMFHLYDQIIKRHLLDGKGTNTWKELVKAIGFGYFVCDLVPHDLRTKVLETVITVGEADKSYKAKNLFEEIRTDELVKYIPLVVLELGLIAVAKKYDWVEAQAASVHESVVLAPDAGEADEFEPVSTGNVLTVEADAPPDGASVPTSETDFSEVLGVLSAVGQQSCLDEGKTLSWSKPAKKGPPPPPPSKRRLPPPTGEWPKGRVLEPGGKDVPPDLNEQAAARRGELLLQGDKPPPTSPSDHDTGPQQTQSKEPDDKKDEGKKEQSLF